MNKNLLISKMKLVGDTQENLSNFIGISLSRLNAKINNVDGAEFTQSEIKKIKKKYNLSNDEIIDIFFTY